MRDTHDSTMPDIIPSTIPGILFLKQGGFAEPDARTAKAQKILDWQPRPARQTILDSARSLIEPEAEADTPLGYPPAGRRSPG
jgi:hypothetical protein